MFTRRAVYPDWIHRGDRRQGATLRTDKVTHLGRRDRGHPVDRRNDIGEAEIQLSGIDCSVGCNDRGFGGFDGRFVRLDLGFGGEVSLDGIIQFLLTDRALLGERCITGNI